ncbi:MAG TPA: branched-chain amino acid ABC transporter permease [Candidatus Methylomirabilis sp.]|nr:branched-chain amino acid ABC transporter permease [Candidatus Methylomirabilis sp.]
MIWIETIVNGVLYGGLYGLLGVGLALIVGVMRVVNLSHGEFIVLSAFIGVSLARVFPGIHPLFLLLPVALIAFALGFLLQSVLVNRVVTRPDPFAAILLTFGVAVVMRNLMVEVYGADPRTLPAGRLAHASVGVGGLSIGVLPILILALSVALFTALQLILRHTRFGRIVRATADNRDVVRLMGVNPGRVYNVVMGLSLALASVAGMLLAMRTAFTPYSGVERLLIAFEVVVLGGLGTFWGAMVGGIVLGIAELVGLRFDPNAGPLYAHLLFLAGVLLRPNGLFGART